MSLFCLSCLSSLLSSLLLICSILSSFLHFSTSSLHAFYLLTYSPLLPNFLFPFTPCPINISSMIILITSYHILGFIDKWISEPLRAIILSSKLFSVNKKKNLFLPPRMQQILVILCAKFQVKEIALYAEKSLEALYSLILLFSCKFVLVSLCTCLLIFLHSLVTESCWYSLVLCIHYLADISCLFSFYRSCCSSRMLSFRLSLAFLFTSIFLLHSLIVFILFTARRRLVLCLI